MSKSISFAGNSLQTSSIITSSVDHHSAPSKSAPYYPLAHANKSVLPFVDYPVKIIVIEGTLDGNGSVSTMDTLEDTFKNYFHTKNANLDIGHGSGTRRYVATAVNIEVRRPDDLAYARFKVEFVCTQPFGQATSATTANSETGLTGATDSFAHDYVGTAPFQLPVITITLNTVTANGGHLAITNNANGQGITIIGQAFVNTDVVEIDCKNRTVKLNGVEVDYIGSFPELAPGSQTLNYQDGFTARNFDITIAYFPLYL